MDIETLNERLIPSGYQLETSANGLQLASLSKKFSPLIIDFVAGKNRHRQLYGGGRRQPLSRAVGLDKNRTISVLDGTAGLGRDAFVMATLGARVTMIERQPVIALLLQDGLIRASQESAELLQEIVQRLTLVIQDAKSYMQNLSEAQWPDVVYLDPMYPHRDKSALVKKEMRIFRDLAGDDGDSNGLLEVARRIALKRVVVKRPIKGERLGGAKADFSITSPNTRYDVYVSERLKGQGQRAD